MSVAMSGGLKRSIAGLAVGMAVLLAACGGGVGGGAPAPSPAETSLPLMFDSLGRQVPEAEFGKGDPLAAGADGIAFDEGPLANAQVSLVDNRGSTRTATTDASGYYRVDIKDLQLPFVLKVKRPDGPEWFSAGMQSAVTRGFVRININGLTSKLLNYVSDALNIHVGPDSDVTPAVLAPNLRLLDSAKARLRAGLAVPLLNAGMDPSSYDPVTTPLAPAVADKHAAFLRSLKIIPNDAGRWAVIGTIIGPARTGFTDGPALSAAFSGSFTAENSGTRFVGLGPVAVDAAGEIYVADTGNHAIRRISRNGIVSTVAGTGSPGFANGNGRSASFNRPVGIALDGSGNIYVADSRNNMIRKISASGEVTTLAGSGAAGFTDGVASSATFIEPSYVAVGPDGTVYVTDAGDAMRTITTAGIVSTLTVGDRDNRPSGAIAVARSGTVFVKTAGGVIYAKSVEGSFANVGGLGGVTPSEALAVDAEGNFYYLLSKTNPLDKLYLIRQSPDSAFTRFEIGALQFSGVPGFLSVDSSGNVLVVDPRNATIRIVLP